MANLTIFQSVCRSRPIAQPSSSPAQQDSTQTYHSNVTRNPIRPLEHYITSDSDDDYIYGIHSLDKSPQVNVTVGGHSFSTIVDTGTTINVIDECTYQTLRGISLQKTTTKAFAYNSTTPVPFLGKLTATVEMSRKITVATFYVTQGSTSGNLLSLSTVQELDLVSLHLNNISKLPNKDPKLKGILERNAQVFDGLGKLKGQTVHLNIDPNASPKAQPQRRIPYHI